MAKRRLVLNIVDTGPSLGGWILQVDRRTAQSTLRSSQDSEDDPDVATHSVSLFSGSGESPTVSDVNRVAFFLPSFERGGVERFVINISPPLVDAGIDADVLVVNRSSLVDQLPEEVRLVDISSSRFLTSLVDRLFPGHVAAGIGSLPGYIRYLRRARPDLVVSMQVSPFAVFGARIAQTDATIVVRESNTPSAATGSPDHGTGRFAPLAKQLSYPRADRVVSVSKDAGEDITSWLGLSESQVRAVYNPTYSERVVETATASIDHPWFEADQPLLVSVGRFSDQKDFETLLEAVARIREEIPVRLVLVGDGDNRSKLERLTRDLGIQESVSFVGYQQNPYPYIAGADLFVFSSHYEGLPNSLIEAIAVGTPAVATDSPSGPREILLNGEGGYLVEMQDAEAMASAIEEALTNPEDAEERVERAQDALDRFAPQRAATEYLELAEADR